MFYLLSLVHENAWESCIPKPDKFMEAKLPPWKDKTDFYKHFIAKTEQQAIIVLNAAPPKLL